MDRLLASLEAAGIGAYEASFTALDTYRGLRPAPLRFILAECGLVDLAKNLEALRYPGLPFADAAIDSDEGDEESGGHSVSYIRCAESLHGAGRAALPPLDLLYDPRRDVFHDPQGIYPSLRSATAELRPASPEDQLFQASILLSRQPYALAPGEPIPLPKAVTVESQRSLLYLILTGTNPAAGLELLRTTGFLDAYWPELARLHGVDQSKEYHPEGDAWSHTIETFAHRKLPSLRLSLALLLHDAGKPQSESAEGRRFDRHAEIGTRIAERFMARLEFPRALVDDVSFLVRYHMLPAALPRLPMSRLEGIVDDPRFPILLELYKCDELSTFRGPDGYYEACAAYRAYLKHRRNPWRADDGRKLARRYLEEAPRSGAPTRAGAAPRPAQASRRRAPGPR
ncbi:MAG TPA: HD domain-containing protein [Rectinemataceae bacterium]|nr:HD domain-containing protein [Rectinemataceae bacterium]